MKIFLDNNYNIIKTEGSNVFGKGNNLNDRVIVIMPNDSIKQNALPLFKFKLASGRTLGAFNCSEVSYQYDENNTAYPFVLTNTILSVKGELEITIEVKLFNENLTPIRTKNVTAKAIVVDNIVLNDDILIIGNEGEIIESVRENVESLNARATQLENTLVNNETIDVDRVNGIIYGKNFYPKANDSTLGNADNRFASAYVNFIVDNNGVAHDTKTLLDTDKINLEGFVQMPNHVYIGTLAFGDKKINLFSPSNMITASNSVTTTKKYVVGTSVQNNPSVAESNSNVYFENDTLNAKSFKAESFEPKENTYAKVGTVNNPFEEVNANFVKADYFNNKSTANKSLVEDAEVEKLKGLPNYDSLNRTIENLQSQIDGINAGQNLADIVGTYDDLIAYNKANLQENDKIQVLNDKNHEGDSTVYNFNGTSFVYVGSYGTNTYTKAEVDIQHNELTERMTQHESVVDTDVTAFKGEVNTKIAQNNTTVNTFRSEILEYVDEAIGDIPALLDELIGA